MRLVLACILGLSCLVAVSSAPAKHRHRGHSHHSTSHAAKINSLKSFAAKLEHYLKRAKGEAWRLKAENEDLREKNKDLKKTPATTTTTTTTTTPEATTNSILECEDDTYKADLNDCKKFYHCAHNKWFPKECEVWLCFDPVLNVCDWNKDLQ